MAGKSKKVYQALTGGIIMTMYRIDRRDVATVRDILDMTGLRYELSDSGLLYLEADYNSVLDSEGICYCEM